jgi:hypothetical protein
LGVGIFNGYAQGIKSVKRFAEGFNGIDRREQNQLVKTHGGIAHKNGPSIKPG